MKHTKGIPITIFGKKLEINCPEGEQQQLLHCAELLDSKMRESGQGGRILSFEDRLLIASLNIAQDLLQAQSQPTQSTPGFIDKIHHLEQKIEHLLTHQRHFSKQTEVEMIEPY